MKPILSLKRFRAQQTTGLALLKAMASLFSNAKRHLRGPMYSAVPGNGKRSQFNVGTVSKNKDNVVSCCVYAAEVLLGTHEAMMQADHIFARANPKIVGDAMITTSEHKGLRALRRGLRKAIVLGEREARAGA